MGETHAAGDGPARTGTVQEQVTRTRAALAEYAPTDCLTVGEAGRLLGLSEALLRRRIQSGKLLHETGKRAGREVRLIRVLDLLAEFGASGAEPGAEPGAGSGTGIEAAARQVADFQPQDQAALRAVQQERDQLLERCADLDTRLSLLANDRPTATLPGPPWMELETLVARRFVWWRRPATWGWAASVAMLAWLWNGAEGDRELAQERLNFTLGQQQLARDRLTAQVGEWREQARVTKLELDRDRQAAAMERTRFEERVLAAHTAAQDAHGQVREERVRFEGDRQRWEDLLAESQRDLRSQGALWRTEIENSAEQQQHFQAELAKRDQARREDQARAAQADNARAMREAESRDQQVILVTELKGQVQASRLQTEQLQEELQRMTSLQDEQEARIAAGLAQWEQLRADESARERALALRVGAKSLGQWLVLWFPRIHGAAVQRARATQGVGGDEDSEGKT